MKSKIVSVTATIMIAFAILLASVLRSAAPRFAYSPMVLSESTQTGQKINIDYVLAYPGKIQPDNPLWYVKVLRDKIWLSLTFNTIKKAELNLLFADKRLNSSLSLFKNNKPDMGLTVLTKSGKYMEKAVKLAEDDKDFYNKLSLASLKHREIIENEILPLTPEDLKPEVIKVEDYSKNTYILLKDRMLKVGLVPPNNPFELK